MHPAARVHGRTAPAPAGMRNRGHLDASSPASARASAGCPDRGRSGGTGPNASAPAAVLDLGSRLVYDTRWVYNGNLAHVLQHHAATLGFVRARLGAGPGDILTILEKDAPPLTRQLLNLLGYETLETHRAVRARLVTLQQLKDVPYHLLPFAATLQPTVLPADHREQAVHSAARLPPPGQRGRDPRGRRGAMATPRSTWKTCRCWNRSR